MKELIDYLNAEPLTPERAKYLKWLVQDRCLHFVYQNADEVRKAFPAPSEALYAQIAPDLLCVVSTAMAASAVYELYKYSPSPRDKLLQQLYKPMNRHSERLNKTIAKTHAYSTEQFAETVYDLEFSMLKKWQQSEGYLHTRFFRPEAQTLNQKLGLLMEAQMEGVGRIHLHGASEVERCFALDHTLGDLAKSLEEKQEWVTPLAYLQWVVAKKAKEAVTEWHMKLTEGAREAIFTDDCAGEDFQKIRPKLEALVAANLAEKFAGLFAENEQYASWHAELVAAHGKFTLPESPLKALFVAGNDRPPPPSANKR